MNTKGIGYLKGKLRKEILDGNNIGCGSDGSVYPLGDSIVAKVYKGQFFYGNSTEKPSNREFRILNELLDIGINVPKPYVTFNLIENYDVLLMEKINGVSCTEVSNKILAEEQFNDTVKRAIESNWHPVDHGAPWDPLEFYPQNDNLIFDEDNERLYFIDVIRWHHITEPIGYTTSCGDGIMRKRLDISKYPSIVKV